MSLVHLPRHATGPGRVLHERGLSLVELMVTLTLGLLLLGVIGSLYLATRRSTQASTQQAQMNEDAALALELLQQQLRLAGFSADRTSLRGDQAPWEGTALLGCDGAFRNANNTRNTADFSMLDCPDTGASTDPDALVIRYEATLLNTLGATASGTPLNCAYESLSAWYRNDERPATTLAENRFFIAPDPSNGQVPTLRCRGRRSETAFSPVVSLVPHIEDLQILYAVTRRPVAGQTLPHQITAYVRAGDLHTMKMAGEARPWSRVMGVRICLVARSADSVPGLTSEQRQYLDCDGQRVTPPADGRLRRAYMSTVMARNLRPALPAPFHAGTSPWRHLPESTGE